jgi:hypothetical protein
MKLLRWLWKHRPDSADVALAEAREERRATEARGVEVRSVTGRLREMRDANHFAESIRRALGEN